MLRACCCLTYQIVLAQTFSFFKTIRDWFGLIGGRKYPYSPNKTGDAEQVCEV